MQRMLQLISDQIEIDYFDAERKIVKLPLLLLKRQGWDYQGVRMALKTANVRCNKPIFKVFNEEMLRTGNSNFPSLLLTATAVALNIPTADIYENLIIRVSSLEDFNKAYQIAYGTKRIKKYKSEAIEKLILVEPKGRRIKVVINDDYKNFFDVGYKDYWSFLFRVASGEEDLEASKHKGAFDYFNSNKQCKLYSKFGHRVTKILKIEDGYIRPNIEVIPMSEKAFQTRLNKDKKAA